MNLPAILTESAVAAGLFRNACMLLAILGLGRIVWLTMKRYNTKPQPQGQWLLAFLGSFLALAAYIAILAVAGAPTGDSFVTISGTGLASMLDFVFLLKGGLILMLIGAFSATKPLA